MFSNIADVVEILQIVHYMLLFIYLKCTLRPTFREKIIQNEIKSIMTTKKKKKKQNQTNLKTKPFNKYCLY